MTTKEKIISIDKAIDEILLSLSEGIEIKEYWIDNMKIQKRSPLELINELRAIKRHIINDAKGTQKLTHKIFVFGDSY